uniref:Glycerol-3-phosphate dehydrogenase [NAD(+)] n=1 Tax=Starmerella magnoliae TaxID=5490 RepID=A4K3A2_9ASCO|nr:glycerol-3-phosphate dehydrogenase [Starmerella magnoliae]
MSYAKKFKACVVGSGNWGTAVAKLVAENAREKTDLFEPKVNMWVFEEMLDGKKLTETINEKHENVKYLPDIKLPENLVANPDLRNVVEDADIVVINIPHQFLGNIIKQLDGIDFSKKYAVSCLKGLNVSPKGPELLSDVVQDKLGMHCGVLSGANIATEVAKEKWCETTVAFPVPKNFQKGDPDAALMRQLFERPYFHVQVSDDTAGVSIGGALKNVVALGAGLVEGAGWGDNAKAGIMRHGIIEMVKFGKTFYPTFKAETICYESAGVADLITTCSSGRNVRVAREAIRQGKSVEVIEKELLNGQSAQGVVTCKEVYELLSEQKMLDDYPLFKAIYDVLENGLAVEGLVESACSRIACK